MTTDICIPALMGMTASAGIWCNEPRITWACRKWFAPHEGLIWSAEMTLASLGATLHDVIVPPSIDREPLACWQSGID